MKATRGMRITSIALLAHLPLVVGWHAARVVHSPCLLGAPPATRHRSPVCMPKGDGKQRRPKQQPPPPPPPGGTQGQQQQQQPRATPGRVNQENSLLKARHQIALARAFKKQQASSGPAKAPVRTSFRKKRDAESNRTKANGPEVEIDLTNIDIKTQLFVDGYNVIGAWPRLKKRFEKGDLSGARDLLLADVADFAAGRCEVAVVFDASGSIERVDGKDRLEEYAGGLVGIVFAHDSADAYIEREARRLRGEGRQVQVATSDNGIATAVTLHGASVMSSRHFVAELKASRNAAGAVVAEFNKNQARGVVRSASIFDALDPSMRKSLEAGIKEAAKAQLSKRDREAMEAARARPDIRLRRPALPKPGAANRARRAESRGAPRDEVEEQDAVGE